MFKSELVIDHKHLKDIHEESLQIPRQINQFLCNRLDGPLKGFGLPSVSNNFTLKKSGRQSNTVRMLGQSVFNKELDFRSRHCYGVSANRPDDVAIRPEAI